MLMDVTVGYFYKVFSCFNVASSYFKTEFTEIKCFHLPMNANQMVGDVKPLTHYKRNMKKLKQISAKSHFVAPVDG